MTTIEPTPSEICRGCDEYHEHDFTPDKRGHCQCDCCYTARIDINKMRKEVTNNMPIEVTYLENIGINVQLDDLALIENGECHFCEDYPLPVIDFSQYDAVPENVSLIGYTLCIKCLMKAVAALREQDQRENDASYLQE